MKSLILKFSFLIALVFVAASCNEDESIEVTAPEAVFQIDQPSITNINLNFALPENPAFTITWEDEVSGASSYDVEIASDFDFTSPIQLGSTDKKTFSRTVAEFNTVLLDLGATANTDFVAYIRLKAGSLTSNTIRFDVIAYAVDPAVITSPSSTTDIVLSDATIDDTALTVSWDDNVDGDGVVYDIQLAQSGTDFTNPVIVASDVAGTTAEIPHGVLNAAAIGVGLEAGVKGSVDMKIFAKEVTESGTLERLSETVTFSLTPYSLDFPYLFFVGAATAPGWDNNNNNPPLFRDPNDGSKYYYTAYFNGDAFKLLEIKGQWQPQWGTNDGSTLAVNDGTGSDPGVFNAPAAGYYTFSVDIAGTSGTFSIENYDASGATDYNTIGMIGSSRTGNNDGWAEPDTDMTQSPFDSHIWYANNITLLDGELKFRANDSWDTNWGSATELFGLGSFDGPGIPVIAGTYDIWFNDLDGSYVLVPLDN
ncbi:SusE domain-containing protein [Spongiivirga citrea]|uniref:SusF/SusE family outer membrane protein n=1 Tax=Spongiivirga citrea TaxID=1481457 RepID=A0A6M0CSV8_9FLAO|nr:SusE domain-containing protein [Spongiivirga citrea]NER16920.1 SusF/SusE family outer membrane protein [Spongiivirga citrea]